MEGRWEGREGRTGEDEVGDGLTGDGDEREPEQDEMLPQDGMLLDGSVRIDCGIGLVDDGGCDVDGDGPTVGEDPEVPGVGRPGFGEPAGRGDAFGRTAGRGEGSHVGLPLGEETVRTVEQGFQDGRQHHEPARASVEGGRGEKGRGRRGKEESKGQSRV